MVTSLLSSKSCISKPSLLTITLSMNKNILLRWNTAFSYVVCRE